MSCAFTNVLRRIISSFFCGIDSIDIGILSQVSEALGAPFFDRLYCQVESCCKKDALISRFGLLEFINSNALSSDQLNFIIR